MTIFSWTLLAMILNTTQLIGTAKAAAPLRKPSNNENKSCDVCLNVIASIVETSMADIKAMPKAEQLQATIVAIKMYCSQQNPLHTSERRMCYYLEPMQHIAAKALVMNMRSDRICKKLNKENPDVCSLVTLTKRERNAYTMHKNDETVLSAKDYIKIVDVDYITSLTRAQKNELKYHFERGIVSF